MVGFCQIMYLSLFMVLKKLGEVYCTDNVNINAESMLIAQADVYIGKNSTLAYRTIITTNANPNAPYNRLCKVYPPLSKDVWIGAGAIILPGCRIGNNCVVAAGSVVCSDVPDNVMVAGVPAKIKKKIEL